MMTATAILSKLAELRAKTDRDLVRIIGHTLELGIRSASAGRRVRAEDFYANALMLLPKVEDVTERRRLETNLERLGETLRPETRTRAMSSSAW